MQEVQDDLHKLAIVLVNVVAKLFKSSAGIAFSKQPNIKRDYIREFNKKMRIYGTDKFSSPTFVSTINYFKTLEDLELNKPIGVIVVYVDQDFVGRLMQMLNYPEIDENDDNALKDACGTFCNVIAGQFKTAISSMGYIPLEMSHFTNYLNTSLKGVDYCTDQQEKYEISFDIGTQKRLVIEMSMGNIPRIY